MNIETKVWRKIENVIITIERVTGTLYPESDRKAAREKERKTERETETDKTIGRERGAGVKEIRCYGRWSNKRIEAA